MKEVIHYDIIGDIHGRFDKLAALMERMDYRSNGAGFEPPAGHMALFLGDLADPKPGHEFPGGVRATLMAGASEGITMVAAMPSRCAAQATPCA